MSGVIFIGGFHELEEICDLHQIKVYGAIDKIQSTRSHAPYLGSDEAAEEILKKFPDAKLHITPDSPKIRQKLWKNYIENYNRDAITLIHPKSEISESSSIGSGCVFHMGVLISSSNKIGKAVKINTGGCITHDVEIEDFVTIAPRAVICSGTKIGVGSYIGANATILPNIKIGKYSVIGAGSVVTKDIDDKMVVYGNPAKIGGKK